MIFFVKVVFDYPLDLGPVTGIIWVITNPVLFVGPPVIYLSVNGYFFKDLNVPCDFFTVDNRNNLLKIEEGVHDEFFKVNYEKSTYSLTTLPVCVSVVL